MFARRLAVWVAAAGLLLGCAGVSEAQLANRTAEEWINTLETPAREQPQDCGGFPNSRKPARLSRTSAGSGIYSLRLPAQGADSSTPWISIRRSLITSTGATETGSAVRPCLDTSMIALPETVDRIYQRRAAPHRHRAEYLKARVLKPGRRVAIIEFIPERDHTNDPTLQVSQEQATAWMTAAGLAA